MLLEECGYMLGEFVYMQEVRIYMQQNRVFILEVKRLYARRSTAI